jgi:hypothetical protein
MSRGIFWSRKARAPRALLAWEIGAGFTHAQNLWGVARHLSRIGVECLVAMADPRFDPWFRTLGARVAQTYLWPIMRSTGLLPQSRPNRVFCDILANYGMSQPGNVSAALAHYETLFALFQPDIVLCENAFGALLAARGRAPAIVFGSTLLFMPPRLGDAFAPIDPGAPDPSWPVAGVLDGLNAGLGALARDALFSVADMFDGAAVMPFGPAAFDPYGGYRKEPVLPPYCPDLPHGVVNGTGDEIIVYLHEAVQLVDPAMRAILEFPAPVRVYIPALGDDWRARFVAGGIVVEDRMMPLRMIVEKARCLVHHGGVTLTAAALAHAVPQIILARFYENGLAGRYVAERGLGAHCRLDSISAEWMLSALDRVLSDPRLPERALATAPACRAWFAGDPTHAVACKAAEILRLKPPPLAPGGGPSAWSAI